MQQRYYNEWLPRVLEIAKKAGDVILPFFQAEKKINIRRKTDYSPQTDADLSAHQEIVRGLSQLTPSIPILSEEGEIASFEQQRCHWERYWLTDPLDGTRGFLHNSNEFSVNIALIEKHRAVIGVIYAPVMKNFFYAVTGFGAYSKINEQKPQSLTVKSIGEQQPARLIMGQYHGQREIEMLQDKIAGLTVMRLNSSLKFGYIAAAEADFYPRFGPTNEWDTAAGQCILEEAGGVVVDFGGNPLRYNVKSSLINPPFLAIGDVLQLKQILFLLRAIERNQ